MKRRCSRGLLVALLLMILFFFPMLAPPVHRIDSDHFALIRNGMSLDEVELILGVPAGRYDWAVPKSRSIVIWDSFSTDNVPNFTLTSTTFPLTIDASQVSATAIVTAVDFDSDGMPDLVIAGSRVGRQVRWISRHGAGTIWFDEQRRVIGKSSWGETSIEPPWHNWRKWFKK
jgi:hypothetical protein